LNGGEVTTIEGSSFLIGTLTYRPNEQVALAKTENGKYAAAWVGTLPGMAQKSIDTAETLGNLLLKRSAESLQNTPPAWAGCVFDQQTRCCWLVGDSCRLQPIYYSQQNDALIFCSKITALLRSGLVDWNLNRQALLDFFTYEHVLGDKTFADNISVLPPASVLYFENGSISVSSYADESGEGPNKELSCHDVAETLYEELAHSVQQSLQKIPLAAITLSGGLDSRAIFGCALKASSELKAYTFGQPGSLDIAIAKELADRSGVTHTALHVDGSFLPEKIDYAVNITGGMIAATHFHITALADRIAAETDGVLDGLGGDALTGGHLSIPMFAARKPQRAADILYRSRATVCNTSQHRNDLFEPAFLEEIDYDPRQALSRHFENLGDLPPWWGCHRFDLLERQQRFIQFGPHLLRPQIDVATPFYSPPLLKSIKQAPVSSLIEQRAYLKVHARFLPELAPVPDDKRRLPLSSPQSLRFAKRLCDFAGRRIPGPLRLSVNPPNPPPTDYAHWFRTNLRTFLEQRLLDDTLVFDGILRRRAVEKIVQDHLSSRCNNSSAIGCLLSLASWLNMVKS
jgi:hypothetical protein